jgi:hypothetical protein
MPAEAAYGFSRLLVLRVTWAYCADRLGTIDKAATAIPIKKFAFLEIRLLRIQRIVLSKICELLPAPDDMIKRLRLPQASNTTIPRMD